VSEGVQAAYYDEALQLAACQPTVRGFLIFHVTDETDYNRWQSGVYYADGTPKSSRALVKAAMSAVRAGAYECGEPPVTTRRSAGCSSRIRTRWTASTSLTGSSGSIRVAAVPVEERAAGKDAFADVVEDWAARIDSLRAYTVTGVRPDSDFFLWLITSVTRTSVSWARR
jgi:hypothetical protein